MIPADKESQIHVSLRYKFTNLKQRVAEYQIELNALKLKLSDNLSCAAPETRKKVLGKEIDILEQKVRKAKSLLTTQKTLNTQLKNLSRILIDLLNLKMQGGNWLIVGLKKFAVNRFIGDDPTYLEGVAANAYVRFLGNSVLNKNLLFHIQEILFSSLIKAESENASP